MYNISKASYPEKNYIKILSVLIEACTRLSSSLRPSDVLAQVAQAAYKITDMGRSVIGLYDKHKGVIETVSGFGNAQPLSTYRISDLGDEFAALTHGRAIIIKDAVKAELSSKARELQRSLDIKSALAIPIMQENSLIGVIFTYAIDKPRPIADEIVQAMVALANQAAVALENARLFEAGEEAQKQAQYELEISNLLLRAADTLAESVDLHQIGEHLADVIKQVTGRSRVFIDEVDLKNNELIFLAVRNGEPLQTGGKMPINELSPECRQAINKGETIIVDYSSPSVSETVRKQREAFGAKRALFVPIRIGAKLVGYITVDEPGDDREFTDRDVDVVEGIAAQAAVAIENARLHEKSAVRARTFEAVVQMGSMITSTLNMKDTLIQIMDYATILVDAQAAMVLIPNTQPGILKVAASTGFSGDRTGEELSMADTITLGFDRPKPSFIDNLNMLSAVPLFAESIEQGFVTAGVSPLFFEGNLRGLLVIANRTQLSLTEEDIAAFRLFVVQAATAMRNAERYEAERHIADTLQEALLTVPEKIQGVTYGTLYRSATEAAKVGGDFYDIFEIEHGKVGIIVGDVAGKGIEATALTTVVKNAIKTHAYEGGTPARVMTKTNDFITRINPPGSFVTVFFGVVDLQTGNLIYCSAGHPPAIIKRNSDAVDLLELHSPIIGAFPRMHYQSFTETLKEGDILIIYTDGIIEARCSDDEFFKEERLVELIRNLSVSTIEMPQAIYNTVMGCTGGTLSDDTALLSLSLQ
ncbi:MAG: GAF domain-containing SpoIIE family protein phosphatase [Candidatus Aquicultor sp.]